jgi:hypothetical protein
VSAARRPSDEATGAFLEAADWFIDVVARPEVAAGWLIPSALEGYTTGGLVAHGALAGILRLDHVLDQEEPIGGKSLAVAEYFGPNRRAESNRDDPLLDWARAAGEEMASSGHDHVVQTCREGRDRLAQTLPALPVGRAVPVLRVRGGTTPLSGYLVTRILELIVHGDDVIASVPALEVPEPPTAAVRACLTLCVELAEARVGGMAALRAFTRAERSAPDVLRVL